jgi:hypothetical protein
VAVEVPNVKVAGRVERHVIWIVERSTGAAAIGEGRHPAAREKADRAAGSHFADSLVAVI